MANVTLRPLILTLCLLPSLAFAGMRCGNDLVSEGDRFDQVKKVCGEADATVDMGDRTLYHTVYNGDQAMTVAESIKLDMWVYHLGPNLFSRNLYFENGILVKIELGDRG